MLIGVSMVTVGQRGPLPHRKGRDSGEQHFTEQAHKQKDKCRQCTSCSVLVSEALLRRPSGNTGVLHGAPAVFDVGGRAPLERERTSDLLPLTRTESLHPLFPPAGLLLGPPLQHRDMPARDCMLHRVWTLKYAIFCINLCRTFTLHTKVYLLNTATLLKAFCRHTQTIQHRDTAMVTCNTGPPPWLHATQGHGC